MELRIVNLDQHDALEIRDLLGKAGHYAEDKHRLSLGAVDPLIVSLGFSALAVLATWIVKNRKKTRISLEIEVLRADGSNEHVSFKLDSSESQSETEVLKALQESFSPKLTDTNSQEQGIQ